jgi:hypothetical protein
MKLAAEDIKYLRPSLIVFVLCLLIGGASAGYTYWLGQRAQEQNRQARALEGSTKNKLAQASQEEQELREKITRYLELKQRGYIGKEKRLDWIELLSAIRRDRKLGDLSYELAAQQPTEKVLVPSGPERGGYIFMSSSLKVTSSLLHEEDLLRLLADIEQGISAYPSLRTCTMVRQESDERSLKLKYPLRTECTIELTTLMERAI